MINHSRYQSVKNNKGFGLIQAMVIASILAIMLTTFASYVYQKNMALKAKANRSDYNQLGFDMKSSINQSGTLTKSEDLQVPPSSFTLGLVDEPIDETEPSPTPSQCPSGCTLVETETTYFCEVMDPNCVTTNTCQAGCTLSNP